MSAESEGEGRPRRGAGRTLGIAVIAMLVGYFAAGNLGSLWKDRSPVDRRFETMNTQAQIVIPEGSGVTGSSADAADMAEAAVRRVDALMSPFGEMSDIKRLNDSPAGVWVEVDPLTWTVVMEALRWHRLTGGAFDPTIGPIKRLFAFNRGEAASWPDADVLAEAKSRVGADKLLYEREGMRLAWAVDGMRLDLGAIAKGFAADHAVEALAAAGAKSAMVYVGGELRVMGGKPGNPPRPWAAGVQHPRDDSQVMRIDVNDGGVATSGDYENFFTYRGTRYDHIIDPRTGLPMSEGVASVTVVHPNSCMAADALATSLCVLGPDEGRAFLEQQALGLFSNGVRVVMLVVRDGGLEKIEFVIDTKGGLSEARETVAME